MWLQRLLPGILLSWSPVGATRSGHSAMCGVLEAKAMLGPSKSGVVFTTLVFIVSIAGSFTYLSVSRAAPDHSLCPAAWGWASRQPTFTAALPRCQVAPYTGVQILGSKPTFLPPDAISRGTSNFGSGARMERLGRKLLQGQPVVVALLGGSITWGRGGIEGGSFANRFTRWINATFPHPAHRVVNLGMPAVTSALFAACYDSVPEDADLVILDFAVNDGHTSPPGRDKYGYSFPGGARRGFEQLVRKSLKLRESPAVAMLHFFSWNATRDKAREGGEEVAVGDSIFFRTIEDDLSTIAEFYDTPVLSLRNAVYHLLREQRIGFQWNVSIHDIKGLPAEEQEQLKQAQFFWDENHPWDRTGHRAMAELLQAAVSRGVQSAADMQLSQLERVGPVGVESTAAAWAKLAESRPLLPPSPLPAPMVPGNYEANATSCHLQEEFPAVINSTYGFKYEPRAPQEATYVAQKWGLSADKPGAWAVLEIDSELGGMSGKLQSVQVHLLHLRSWSGMGRAQLKCSSGCKCRQQELDGHWDREATLTDLFSFEVSAHPKCQLKVTVLEESSSREHRVSISGVVVSSVDARMERGKIGQWDYDKQGAVR